MLKLALLLGIASSVQAQVRVASPDGREVVARLTSGGYRVYPVDGGAPRTTRSWAGATMAGRYGSNRTAKSPCVSSTWMSLPADDRCS